MGEAGARRKPARHGTGRRRAAFQRDNGKRSIVMAEREREVIVTNDGGGSGFGMLAGVVLVLAVLAVLFFVFKDRILGGGDTNIKADVKVEGPATGGGN
jgi:hypothetical protein